MNVDSILGVRHYDLPLSSVFDFSAAFYLTDNIEYIQFLANEKRDTDMALIVYDIPETVFSGFPGLTLSPHSPDDVQTWRNLTVACLKPPRLVPSQYEFIEGPLVSGSLQVSRCTISTPSMLKCSGQTPLQLAILNRRLNLALHSQAKITVLYLLPH